MKRLLISFLFIAGALSAQAQDSKPSKEATQKFLNNILSQVVGNPQDALQPKIRLIQKQSFENDFTKYILINGSDNYFRERSEYINVPWQDFTDFIVEINGGIQSYVRIIFKSNMEYESFCCFVDEDKGDPSFSIYTNQFLIYIPTDKLESCKKAFLRLSELAKEENKDPFKN